MEIPICDNPECRYHKISIKSGTNWVTVDTGKIRRKECYNSKENKGYWLCEDCYNAWKKDGKCD